MIIKLDETIFGSANFKGINFLLQLCTYKNRYEVFVELTPDIMNTLDFKSLSDSDKELLIQIYNGRIQSQTPSDEDIVQCNHIICNNPSCNKELNIEEGIRFLIQPVSIVLENSKNDAYFVKAIFKHFDERNCLLDYLSEGWIQFENAGGCDNISNFLEGKMQSFNNLPKENQFYLRCLVLMDSDKLHPTAALSDSKDKTKSFLDRFQIPYKILRKRSMENYLPMEAYQEIVNINFDDWKLYFTNLSDCQKDYLNIETGFSKKDGNGNPKKDRVTVNGETNNLYNDLSEEAYNTLNIGLKQIGDFKTIFPTYFDSPYISKTSLLARAGGTEDDNELIELLQKIYELL